MKGKVCQWKDDKGFGFIQPNDGSERLFFHISSVKTGARRPQVGDVALYDAMRDSHNRLKARRVVIEGVAMASGRSPETPAPRTAPAKMDAIDYLALLAVACALAAAVFQFYRSGEVAHLWPFGLAAAIAVLVLKRQKKPREKTFRCARCKTTATHDARTIKAWNNGFSQLYCKACHRQWLLDNPRQANPSVLGRGGGCLGALTLMVLVPVFGGLGLYQWLA
ncbi:cold shock domain-containing protein [Marinobacterium aestuariivivens]|uniref:Cold shock domain-containing protein n=1 Tax=Marinobacterium aestuariivivens TaxID=1698799 RepID=A0ABW1ZW80_9GAMM